MAAAPVGAAVFLWFFWWDIVVFRVGALAIRWFQSELGTNSGKTDSYTKDCMQSFEEIKKTGIDYQKTVIHT